MRWAAVVGLTSLNVASGCGARSGLGEIDIVTDASVDTAIAVDSNTLVDTAVIDSNVPDSCVCSPGATESNVDGCPSGTSRVRSCESSCAWGEWSDCERRGWVSIAPAASFGLEGRSRHDAVWTGREMVVYGGVGAKSEAAAFDPVADRWRALPPSGLKFASRGLVTWAGDRLFIFSGDVTSGRGAELDLTTNKWTLSPPAPIGRRSFTTARYLPGTGEVVIWSGSDGATALPDGAAYRVATRTWRRLSPSPLTPRWNAAYLASGSKLAVFGGGDNKSIDPNDAAIWDATLDRWTYIATTPLGGRRVAFAVSEGTSSFVFGGIVPLGTKKTTGATFDVDTFAFKAIPPHELFHIDETWAACAWAGAGRLWMFGGNYAAGSSDHGASFDPGTGAWTPMPPGGPSGREFLSAVWTGREAIVWGGCCEDGGARFADGAIYRP